MYKRLIKAKLKEKSSKYIIFSIFLIFITNNYKNWQKKYIIITKSI